jgi:xylan 1,4-beta-xylosidase
MPTSTATAQSTTLPTNQWAEFTNFEYQGTDTSPEKPGPGQFINPILAGMYPDPSICRVGDNFYLVNSTFGWFPGIPIFQSKDLVNWTKIGHVLDRPGQVNLNGLGVGTDGVYAPAISYHDGTFYLLNTLVRNGGNFFVTAKNPAGPWSDPTWLHEIDGIDPSFFFDDDGKAYIIHNGPPPENHSLYNGHRALYLFEFDIKAGAVIGASKKLIVDGGTDISKHPSWIEGPHIFKRNGHYYLIAAEGGTGDNHSEVVFRSDSVWGPYVPFEGNPILTQRQLDPNRADPVTTVGHADFVQLPNGDWWSVFLGSRPYENGLTNIGRETFLLPVKWENDWPMILPGKQAVPRILDRPNLPPQPPRAVPHHGPFSWHDDFDSQTLSSEWNFLRAPGDWYSLSSKPGSLLIEPRPIELSSRGLPSFIGHRQQHADFTATTELIVNPGMPTSDVGIAAFQNETHYFFLGVHIENGNARQIFLEEFASSRRNGSSSKPAQIDLPEGTTKIQLKIQGKSRPYSFYYRIGNGDWTAVKEDADGSILSTHAAGGFVGSYIGLFARTAK